MRCMVFIVLALLLAGCSLSRFEKIPAEISPPPPKESQNFLRAVEQLSDEKASTELEAYATKSSDETLRKTAQLVLQLVEEQNECFSELEGLKQENQLLAEQIEQLKSLLIELENRPQ